MDFEEFVLAAATADLADAAAAREHADALEFRMDLADEPVRALRDYDGDLPIIATNRVEWEGGEAADTRERLDALRAAAEHPRVEAVDLELGALLGERGGEDGPDAEVVRDVRAHARDHGAAVIASVHDFETTPPPPQLRDLLASGYEAGDVAKAAVTAQNPDHVLAVLSTTRVATREGETVATMAMGEVGRHSRAVAPLYGSRIGYAPPDPEAATAPGQYDLATLAELVETLRSRPEMPG